MAKKSSSARSSKKSASRRRTIKHSAHTTLANEVSLDDMMQECPAPPPRERGYRRFSDEQVADALRNTGGVYSDAARWLQGVYKRKCSRVSVCRYVAESPYLQHVMKQVDEAKGDYCERRLWAHIEAGSERSLHFFMATKMKDRGYAKRTEISGPGGGALPVQSVPSFDLSGLNDDELKLFEELLDRASATSSSAVPSTS